MNSPKLVIDFLKTHDVRSTTQLAPDLVEFLDTPETSPDIQILLGGLLSRLTQKDWDLAVSIGYVVDNRVYDRKFEDAERHKALAIFHGWKQPEFSILEYYLAEMLGLLPAKSPASFWKPSAPSRRATISCKYCGAWRTRPARSLSSTK